MTRYSRRLFRCNQGLRHICSSVVGFQVGVQICPLSQVAGKLLVQQMVARSGENAEIGIDLGQGRVGPITPWKAVLAATACFDRAIQARPRNAAASPAERGACPSTTVRQFSSRWNGPCALCAGLRPLTVCAASHMVCFLPSSGQILVGQSCMPDLSAQCFVQHGAVLRLSRACNNCAGWRGGALPPVPADVRGAGHTGQGSPGQGGARTGAGARGGGQQVHSGSGGAGQLQRLHARAAELAGAGSGPGCLAQGVGHTDRSLTVSPSMFSVGTLEFPRQLSCRCDLDDLYF